MSDDYYAFAYSDIMPIWRELAEKLATIKDGDLKEEGLEMVSELREIHGYEEGV